MLTLKDMVDKMNANIQPKFYHLSSDLYRIFHIAAAATVDEVVEIVDQQMLPCSTNLNYLLN